MTTTGESSITGLTKQTIMSTESAISLGMDGNDVKKSSFHLNTMALFLYFPVVLHNVIFTNPQYLLDMLSALIRVSFVDSLEDILLEGKSIALDTQRTFREFGVFEESLLDSVCLLFVCFVFTKHAFLMLLRYQRIITPLSTTDGVKRYFMPVVLLPQQVKEKDIVLYQRKGDPMIITFRSKIVPLVSNSFVPFQQLNLLMAMNVLLLSLLLVPIMIRWEVCVGHFKSQLKKKMLSSYQL